MPVIEVFGRRNSANVQKVMWVLGEVGRAYRRHDIGGSFGFPDEYAELNPNRLVPAIRDGDLTLWESNACVRYLARTYGDGTLWPRDAASVAIADQWMDWQGSQLSHCFFQVFFNLIRLPEERADRAAIASGIEGCAEGFSLLDRVLSDRAYVAGDALTMGDIPVGVIAYRYLAMDIERPALDNVNAWYRRLSERPAYRRHVMIPFGSNSDQWLEEEARGAGVQ